MKLHRDNDNSVICVFVFIQSATDVSRRCLGVQVYCLFNGSILPCIVVAVGTGQKLSFNEN